VKEQHVKAAASAWKTKVGDDRARKAAAVAEAKKAEANGNVWRAKMCGGKRMRRRKEPEEEKLAKEAAQNEAVQSSGGALELALARKSGRGNRASGGGRNRAGGGGLLLAGMVSAAVHGGVHDSAHVGGSTAARERFLHVVTPLHQRHCDELPYEEAHFLTGTGAALMHTALKHCTHILHSSTARMHCTHAHCTHALHSYTALKHCTHPSFHSPPALNHPLLHHPSHPTHSPLTFTAFLSLPRKCQHKRSGPSTKAHSVRRSAAKGASQHS
jgi:hypothetical protein